MTKPIVELGQGLPKTENRDGKLKLGAEGSGKEDKVASGQELQDMKSCVDQ